MVKNTFFIGFLMASLMFLFISCKEEEGPGIYADFSVTNQVIGPGSTVYFTDKSRGTLVSWDWDFGDGGISTHQNPSHTYDSSGIYSVSLSIETRQGSFIETKTDYITVGLIADFKTNVSDLVYVGQTVEFTDQSKGKPSQWEWDYGDGDTLHRHWQNPFHRYDTVIDSVTVSLKIANNDGFSDTIAKKNVFTVKKLSEFHAERTLLHLGQPAQFICVFSDSIAIYDWNFGEGTDTTGHNPIYYYTTPGIYSVSLTAKNDTANPFGAFVDYKIREDYITYTGELPSVQYNGTLYVHPVDNKIASRWDDYDQFYRIEPSGETTSHDNCIETGATDQNNGASNTAIITDFLSGTRNNNAATICDTLNAFGYSDWYLPAINELEALYQNKEAIGFFGNSIYWSSTEKDKYNAYYLNFDNGNVASTDKNHVRKRSVRCVRRD